MTRVIKAENLSKKYILNHDSENQAYHTLRDAIASGFKRKKWKAFQDEFWALNDLSFEINQGDRVGIVGRNGAGKSTLLKVLSRITEPTSGKISMKGRVASLLEVGTGFHPELTGRENIYLNGAILGMSRGEIKKNFDDIVSFAEVERFLDTPVKRYSSGMYMRLAFAVAAHLQTEILVVDEVLAVGDVNFQKKCMEKMGQVSRLGRTILFVSHNMNAIKTLCTQGIFLQKGYLIKQGDISDIVNLYKLSGEERAFEFPIMLDHLILHSFELTQNSSISDYMDGSMEFQAEIDFELTQDVSNFRIGIYVKSMSGETILRSFLADWNHELEKLKKGRRKIFLNFPASFLAKGHYLFELHASEFGRINYLGNAPIYKQVFIDNPANYNLAHLGETFDAYIINSNRWIMRE